jgi:hypothetical protein
MNVSNVEKFNISMFLMQFEIAKRQLAALPGVDVMITIFCNFYPFLAEKLAFFSQTNVVITIFAKTSFVLRQKRQYLR